MTVSVFPAIAMSLVVRESAVAWSRSATGAVTMMTISFTRSYIYICISDGGAFGGGVVVSTVVREGAVTFVTTVTICCDNNVDAW